jgi:hypothetical protein
MINAVNLAIGVHETFMQELESSPERRDSRARGCAGRCAAGWAPTGRVPGGGSAVQLAQPVGSAGADRGGAPGGAVGARFSCPSRSGRHRRGSGWVPGDAERGSTGRPVGLAARIGVSQAAGSGCLRSGADRGGAPSGAIPGGSRRPAVGIEGVRPVRRERRAPARGQAPGSGSVARPPGRPRRTPRHQGDRAVRPAPGRVRPAQRPTS